MGMDISGGMIIGEHGSFLGVPEGCELDFSEWAENNKLDCMAESYDCDASDKYYGYTIPDIKVEDINIVWLVKVQLMATKFKEVTGVEARLIGCQHVF